MRRFVLSLLMTMGIAGMLCSACRSSAGKGDVNLAHRILRVPSRQVVAKSAPAAESASAAPTASLKPTTTKHFQLLHEPGAGFVPLAGRTLESAYRHFYEVFAQAGFDLSRPKDRLVWLCFPQKSGFNQYALQVEGMDLSWLDGYYSTLTNRVAIVQTDEQERPREEPAPPVDRDVRVAVTTHRSAREGVLPMSAAGQRFDVTRLTHEVAHQLSFNSGIQRRGVVYPLWVSEGLATNFEFNGNESPGLDHINVPRLKGLQEAYTTGELAPLRQLVVQTTVPPDAVVGRRYYAQAWGFFHFILTERPENLRAYLHRVARTRTERRDATTLLAEFTEAFGPVEMLEPAWLTFVARHVQRP